MASLRDLVNGYDMGGGNVEKGGGGESSQYPGFSNVGGVWYPYDPQPGHLGSPPGVDWNSGGGDPNAPIIGGDPAAPAQGGATPPATQPGPGGWQMPGMAFAPGASQNAPRLFQDPTTGAWTLSEHGNFRGNLSPDDVTSAQGYVTDFWNQFPTGFIQPGQTNYDPNQSLTNAGYGQPSNWQSMYTNAGLTPPTQSATPTPSIGQAQPAWPQTTVPTNGGPLSELSNPERVNQLSQSSYGGGDDDFMRRLKAL